MSGVPGPFSRFVVLFLTPLYLMLLASILSRVSDLSFPFLIVQVFFGAAVIVTIITVLTSRFHASHKQPTKFSISTLLMVIVICSIYMAYISEFLRKIQTIEITSSGVIQFLLFALAFVAITTFVLIRFAEAITSVAEGIMKLARKITSR